MHLEGSRRGDYQKRREAIWVAVSGYGYLAPGRIATDEQRERAMIEAAQGRLLAMSAPTGQRLSPRQGARRRLNDIANVIGASFHRLCARKTGLARLPKSAVGRTP
jgi:hypothetical protein